ncbi:MAG: hypothetical protein SFW66_03605 [Gammaproteobacteria bacterium]|nr:hypothetical protein [Gammaproteobacteria bacterium]
MLKYCLFVVLSFMVCFSLPCRSESAVHKTAIRLAILDNFTSEKFAQKYKIDYFAGIDTAIFSAKQTGILIEYKVFTYGNKPLAILNALCEVEQWKPDLIIGPHLSNQFLLLKKYIKHTLVVSPYATDVSLKELPTNFYSLSLPDEYIANANVLFVKKYFPGKDIFNITQADCKDCVDMALLFNKLYHQYYPTAHITDRYYTGNHVELIDMQRLLEGYQPGSIILLQPLSYVDAQTLMKMISDYLPMSHLIFVYNLDNWGNSSAAKKEHRKINNYLAYKISPLVQNENSKTYSDFLTQYQKLFGEQSKNAVTYMSYSSVISVVDALKMFPQKKHQSMRKNILKSFMAARETDPNWHRPGSIMVYALTQQGEQEQGIIANYSSYEASRK